MSYWKPGERYPDGYIEKQSANSENILADDSSEKGTEHKLELSENIKNMPVFFFMLWLLLSL